MSAIDCDACRLFVDRAQALDPEFKLTTVNARTIVSTCQRLGGLPQAIELAAAWVSVLSPGALLTQLEHRRALSSGGSLATPQRQRSLRDTIAWSYSLLSAPLQALFRRIAVFHSGCSPDAIMTICGDDSLDLWYELRRWSRTVWSGGQTTQLAIPSRPCARSSWARRCPLAFAAFTSLP